MKHIPLKLRPTGWTEERVDLLKGLWKDGLSASQIARTLGNTTRNAVLGKALRLKLAPRAVSERQISERKSRSKISAENTPRIRNRFLTLNLATGELTDIRDMANEPVALTLDDGRHIGSLEIKSKQCRWPHGDPKQPGFHFCAHPIQDGSPYCPHHVSRAFQAIRKPDPNWQKRKVSRFALAKAEAA